VADAAEARGSENVLVTSFTKAAAIEVASRDVPISQEQIGTLHAFGYRALGKPEIAEMHVSEWNEEGSLVLRNPKATLDEPYEAGAAGREDQGNKIFLTYQTLRAKMVSRDLWPEQVRRFAQGWEAWKKAKAYVDFQDMIEIPLRDMALAPGNPSVIFADECQDLSILQWALLRKWGEEADDLIVVGDVDQTLYEWRGASPVPFLVPLPEGQIRALKQSYRVPRSVLEISRRWIRQIEDRPDVVYAPRDAEGEVRRAGLYLKRPNSVAQEILTTLDKEPEDSINSLMVLASCAYMLKPLLAVLKREGIPFHNPYRRTRGDWNPLRRGRGNRLTATDRLLAFMRPDQDVWGQCARMWTYDDVAAFIPLLSSEKVLLRGAKKKLHDVPDDERDREARLSWLLEFVFNAQAMDKAFELDLDWFERSLLRSRRKVLAFPLRVLRRDKTRLNAKPRITVGTIHSVKGGEARDVFLFPDLSPAGFRSWIQGGGRKDGIVRQFYVGMTRARNSLTICESSSARSVRIV